MTEAARIMWENDCGSVPVAADQAAVWSGSSPIATCGCVHAGQAAGGLRVADAMSGSVRTCGPGDEIPAAAGAMRAAQIRRLPVVDAAGQLLGIVSLSDIAREFARQRARGKKGISAVEVGELLAGICEPRKLEAGPAKARR
jgi:predicted transcriptional regulator